MVKLRELDAVGHPVFGQSWKPVVRGFTMGHDVLTEVGWVAFEEWRERGWLGEVVPWELESGSVVLESDMRFRVTDAAPRVASVAPGGGVAWVSASLFLEHEYSGLLTRVKARGVELFGSLFCDLWVLPKYGRSWKFASGDAVVRGGGHRAMRYGFVNKFSVDLYGDFVPEAGSGEVRVVRGVDIGVSGMSADVERPLRVEPRSAVSRTKVERWFQYGDFNEEGRFVAFDRIRTSVPVFNLVAGPYHSLIVRRSKADRNPRTRWVGGPVVVGDGRDKAFMHADATKARLGSVSGGVFRPDVRFQGSGASVLRESVEP